MALPDHHVTNLETLYRAAAARSLAVVECRRRSDGKVVAMLCAIGIGEAREDFAITPFAEMVDGNPFEMYDPPNPAGGFEEGETS